MIEYYHSILKHHFPILKGWLARLVAFCLVRKHVARTSFPWIVFNIRDVHCLEDSEVTWWLSYPGARWWRVAPSCRAPQGHDQIREKFQFLSFFRPEGKTNLRLLQFRFSFFFDFSKNRKKWNTHKTYQGLVVTMWRVAARGWSPFTAARLWGVTIPWALRFLAVRETWLFRLVSPRMHVSSQVLWTIFTHQLNGLEFRSATVWDSFLGPTWLAGCSSPA